MGDLSGIIQEAKDEANNAKNDAHDALTSINARKSLIHTNITPSDTKLNLLIKLSEIS